MACGCSRAHPSTFCNGNYPLLEGSVIQPEIRERWESVMIDDETTGAEVSDQGRFKDTFNRYKTPGTARTAREADAYVRVKILSIDYIFHRLVLTAFHGPCPNGHSGCALA